MQHNINSKSDTIKRIKRLERQIFVEKYKVVIADDNVDDILLIKNLIEPFNDFTVVGMAYDGQELVQINSGQKPDLVIVDMVMPKLYGLEAIEQCLQTSPDLKFIVISRHEDFALQALELSAIDYLIKPITEERFLIAMEKAYKSLSLSKWVNEKEEESQNKKLLIKYNRNLSAIPLNSIVFLEKVNRKTYVYTKTDVYETYESLESLSKKLNDQFYACHRSFIININHVSHIKNEGETYFVYFEDYEKYAHVSRLKIQELQTRLQETTQVYR